MPRPEMAERLYVPADRPMALPPCADTAMRYPVIDMEATGRNIRRIRVQKGVSVRELARFLGLSDVQAVYKWQSGLTLPSLDNLIALSRYLDTPVEQILVIQ